MGFEAHLMVQDPDPMLPRWVEAGCGIVIVHVEAVGHLHRTLGRIAELGARAGVALNPATPLSAVEHVLDLVDLVLVMTVNPGFGGQRYLASMEPKIAAARAEIDRRGLDIELEVDGGIGTGTIGAASAAGARVFCAGSALFGGDMADRVATLRAAAAAGVAA
jgi:ribulose-phosphate 3-epimerase